MTLHLVEPTLSKPPIPSVTEPWVDLDTLAAHLGFGYQATRRMVIEGKLPGKPMKNGKKTFWRFRLSVVDAYLESHSDAQAGTPLESTVKP